MWQRMHIWLWLVLLAGLMILAGPAAANAAKTLTLGQGSGQEGDTVSVPVNLDDPNSEVGGLAFTIGYNDEVLEFVGLAPSDPPPLSNGTEYLVPAADIVETNSTRYEYYNPYQKTEPYLDADYTLADNSTLFYQANGESPGRVMVAAASAVPINDSSLFNADFKIKSGAGYNGDTTLELYPSIIDNPAAGYDGPTNVPVLTGMPADQPSEDGYYQTPTYEAALEAGTITVQASSFTISGTVEYDDKQAADGVEVVLKKQSSSGQYTLNDTAVTGDAGSFVFSDKFRGTYKLLAYSERKNYYNAQAVITLSDGDVTGEALVLPGAARYSGEVYIGSEEDHQSVSGVKVRVTDADGNVVGVYPVVDGSFNIGNLPPGEYEYTLTAVYGSQTKDLGTAETAYWDLDLNSIQGTVDGLGSGDQVALKAVSHNATLSKTVLSDPAEDNGTVAYQVDQLLPASDYIVSATGGGYPVMYYDQASEMSNATEVDISAGNATDIDFHFGQQDTGIISGQVSKDETSLSEVDVYAYDRNTSSMSMAATGSDGQYSLNLPPGEYQVFTIQSGKVYYYADAGTTQNENKATLLTLETGDNLSGKDLSIPSYNKTISGKVSMDNGDPVPNALVKARNQNDDSQAMDLTAADGTFTLTGLSDGSYVVKMDPIGTDYPVQTQSADAGDSGIDFVIKTLNTLSGQVTDDSDTEKPGAMLYLVNRDTGMIHGGRTYSSDAKGEYSISGIPNGVYKLVVLHKDYEAYEASLTLDQDVTHNVSLSSGAWIGGTVTEADTDDPLHNVLIVVTGGNKPQYDLTGKQGGYEVNGLADGQTYTLNAKKSGYEPKSFSVNASSTGTKESFSLAEPQAVHHLSGTVTLNDENGTAVENAVVVVHSASQQFKDSTSTDQDGNYSFADLPQAEDYSVVVVPPGDLQVQTETLDLNSDKTLDVAIPSGNAISGTVTWSETGYVDLLLFAADTDELIAWQTLESDETEFQFRGLNTDASYTLLAIPNGKNGTFYENANSIGDATPVLAGSSNVEVNLN